MAFTTLGDDQRVAVFEAYRVLVEARRLAGNRDERADLLRRRAWDGPAAVGTTELVSTATGLADRGAPDLLDTLVAASEAVAGRWDRRAVVRELVEGGGAAVVAMAALRPAGVAIVDESASAHRSSAERIAREELAEVVALLVESGDALTAARDARRSRAVHDEPSLRAVIPGPTQRRPKLLDFDTAARTARTRPGRADPRSAELFRPTAAPATRTLDDPLAHSSATGRREGATSAGRALQAVTAAVARAFHPAGRATVASRSEGLSR